MLLCKIQSWYESPRRLRIARHSRRWLSLSAYGESDEERDQNISAKAVAACVSQAVQLRSRQAFPYQVIWSSRLNDSTVKVDARRPSWV